MEKYKFRNYDKKFPLLYRREKYQIEKVLPKEVYIEHIGSTSVVGLRGKGLIDIIIGVSKSKINKIKIILIKSGYGFIPDAGNKNRLFFIKDYISKGKTRRVHLHLVEYGSKEWFGPIAVRDYLRTNKKEHQRYEKIKRKAVKIAKGGGEKYRKAKNKYLQKLTIEALN